jgi:hypothetical protein
MCILILSLIHHRAFFWPHLFFNELIPINTQQKAVCAHYEGWRKVITFIKYKAIGI